MSYETMIQTRANPWRKARSVNETSNGYVSKIPTATEPVADAGTATGQASIDLTDPTVGGAAQNGVMFLPFGVGSDNNTFSLRVIGWSCCQTDRRATVNPDTNLWIPVVLGEFLCTLSSTPVGVAGRFIVATELFADTIAVVGSTANNGVSCDVVSPANNTIASVFMDLRGSQKLEFQFTTGGSATSCNALFKLF